VTSYEGHVALVTGAASGIGRELARQLAGRRSALALVDVNGDGLASLARQLHALPVAVSVHQGDVGDDDAVARVVGEAVERHGRVSMRVNNAAVSISAPFDATDPTEFRGLFATNFWGPVSSAGTRCRS